MPWLRDPARLEQPHHRSHHALPVRGVQPGRGSGTTAVPDRTVDPASRVVRQGGGNLSRCAVRRAGTPLAAPIAGRGAAKRGGRGLPEYKGVVEKGRPVRNSPVGAHRPTGDRLLRSMKMAKVE